MSLVRATPISNYVLVKLEKNDSVVMDSGVVLYIPPPTQQNNREEHAPLRGEVVGLPAGLYFRQGDHSGLKWKTEMELQLKDKVIIKRPALSMAIGKDHPSYFVENDEVYVYIKYDELIVAIRGEEVIVLNGYVIVEPSIETYDTTLIVPDTAKKESKTYGIVRFIGSQNQEYHITKNAKSENVIPRDEVPWVRKENGEIKIDLVELKVGDKIQFKASTAIALEQDLHRTLAGRHQKLYRMQRINIQAKL